MDLHDTVSEIRSSEMRANLGVVETQRVIREALNNVESRIDRWFDAPSKLFYDRPADGSWSIAENLEHISLTNHFLLKIISRHVARAVEKAASGAEPQDFTDNLDKVEQIRDRASFNWKNPTHMTPMGKTDLSEVRSLLRTQFEKCKEFMDQMPNGEGYLVRVNMTVNNLGKINMYEWIYFLVQHAMRHEDKLSSVVGGLNQLQLAKLPKQEGM